MVKIFSLEGRQEKSVSFGTVLVYLSAGDFSALWAVQVFVIILYCFLRHSCAGVSWISVYLYSKTFNPKCKKFSVTQSDIIQCEKFKAEIFFSVILDISIFTKGTFSLMCPLKYWIKSVFSLARIPGYRIW